MIYKYTKRCTFASEKVLRFEITVYAADTINYRGFEKSHLYDIYIDNHLNIINTPRRSVIGKGTPHDRYLLNKLIEESIADVKKEARKIFFEQKKGE